MQRLYDSDSLFDLDPGPWAKDPETDYWATFDGRVAIPAWLGELSTWNRWTDQPVITIQFRKPKWPRVHTNAKGYLRLHSELVHRVVARAWVPNPNCKPQVHHVDHVKHNNHVENLRWVDNSENITAAYDFGLMRRKHNNKGQFV